MRGPCWLVRVGQSYRALEDITLHRQLGDLTAKPLQLNPSGLGQRPGSLRPVGLTVPGNPVPERALIDPQVPGDLRDQLSPGTPLTIRTTPARKS